MFGVAKSLALLPIPRFDFRPDALWGASLNYSVEGNGEVLRDKSNLQ